MPAGPQKAIFLDRDGVVNQDHGYIYTPSELQLFPDITGFLRWLKESSYLVFVITNQSGVARGKFNLYDVLELDRLINQQLRIETGHGFDGFYICPHLPAGIIPEYRKNCACRKPGIELVLEAAKAWNLDLQQCWMIGDKESDVQCALAAKMQPIFLSRDDGPKKLEIKGAPIRVVRNLLEAQQVIASQQTIDAPH